MRSTTKEICFAFCYLLAKGWFYATLFKLNVVMELRIKAYFVLSLVVQYHLKYLIIIMSQFPTVTFATL